MNPSFGAADFVTRFAEFWKEPSPERLPELLHSDVVMVQPLVPTMIGIRAAQTQFQRIFRCFPGLHAHIDRWCAEEDLVFIEFRMRTRVGRETLEWPNVNRLLLRGEKARERITYFDPLAVLPMLLRHPSIGWQWMRSGRP